MKLTFNLFLFIFLSFFICDSSYATNSNPLPSKAEEIKSYIQQSMQRLNLPGVAVATIEAGETTLLDGFGTAATTGQAITHKTVFQLGSLSKSITALAIVKLAEDGLIDLKSPVTRYIPWFKSQNKTLSDKILIEHLLNHRSGFSAYDGNRNLSDQDNSRDAYKDAVSQLAQISLVAAPGEVFEYSNINYQILGYLLEVIEAKSFEQVIQEKVFQPLGMLNSFASDNIDGNVQIAQGNYFHFGQPRLLTTSQGRVTIAQGRIYSTAEDMLKYISHLLDSNSQYIPNSVKQNLFAFDKERGPVGYGAGWFIQKKADHKIVFHFGRSFGYEAVAMFSPEKQVGVVVLANAHTGFGDNNVGALLRGVGGILLGDPPVDISSPIIDKVLFWSLFIVPFLILLSAIRFVQRYRQNYQPLATQPFNIIEVLIRLVVPSVFLLGLAYTILIFLPGIHKVTLEVVAMSEPLLYKAMLLCSFSALSWFVIRTGLIIYSLKRKTLVQI